MRRTCLGLAIVATATAMLIADAGAAVPAQGQVGARQYFWGFVNAQAGLAGPVTIKMACFGAVRPGQKGHPMSGQTVEVLRPEGNLVRHSGHTGKNATSIVAFFGPPPPSPAPATPAASAVTFKKYGVDKPIPTSLLSPCSGTGTVSFVPLPKSPPTSTDATVRVTYVGQP